MCNTVCRSNPAPSAAQVATDGICRCVKRVAGLGRRLEGMELGLEGMERGLEGMERGLKGMERGLEGMERGLDGEHRHAELACSMKAGRAEVQQLQVDLQVPHADHGPDIVCLEVSMHQPTAVQHHKAL